MLRRIKLIGIGGICFVLVFCLFLGEANEKTYANEDNHLDSEIDDAKDAYEKMDPSTQEQLIGSIAPDSIDLNQVDIETALMLVQQLRTELLDAQFKEQIEKAQALTKYINELSTKLDEAQKELNELNTLKQDGNLTIEQNARIQELESIIQNLKTEIEKHSNSHHIEIQRINSLANKRMEAYEVLSNHMKKMQDYKSGILGNLR